MRVAGFLKTLVLIAAIVTPLLLLAADSFAESGAHRQGPTGGSVRSTR